MGWFQIDRLMHTCGMAGVSSVDSVWTAAAMLTLASASGPHAMFRGINALRSKCAPVRPDGLSGSLSAANKCHGHAVFLPGRFSSAGIRHDIRGVAAFPISFISGARRSERARGASFPPLLRVLLLRMLWASRFSRWDVVQPRRLGRALRLANRYGGDPAILTEARHH